MQRVLWIGGPPGSGKTSIATRLARRHGLRLYSADTQTWIHRDRALAVESGPARRFEELSPVERWEQPTDDLLAMSLHDERGPMVLEDVRNLPTAPLIIAEGTPVVPSVVSMAEMSGLGAVWLIPTAAFQDEQLAARQTPEGHALLHRRLTDEITTDVEAQEAPFEVVDGSRSLDEMTNRVEARFADIVAAGPRADSLHARRNLHRQVNVAIVDQIRGFHARPWANGNPDAVTRDFICECGDPTCEAFVSLSVGEASAAPVLAHRPGTPDQRRRARCT